MNEMLIFSRIVPLAFNTFILTSFPMAETPLKFSLLIWYEAVLLYFFYCSPHPHICLLWWIYSLQNKKKLYKSRSGEYGSCFSYVLLKTIFQKVWFHNFFHIGNDLWRHLESNLDIITSLEKLLSCSFIFIWILNFDDSVLVLFDHFRFKVV